jgi:transcriptional regulator with XRE-family HTH domain
VDGSELGRSLRARRKAAGRTIASVAMDAGLSVPYIANLENGRGNPTLAALQRLSGALGAELRVDLQEPDGAAPVPVDPGPDLMDSLRARAVAKELARVGDRDPALVRQHLRELGTVLTAVIGCELDVRDVDRTLDMLTLSRSRVQE